MIHGLLQACDFSSNRKEDCRINGRFFYRSSTNLFGRAWVLTLLAIALSFGSDLLIPQQTHEAYAASALADTGCSWYIVRPNDTLAHVASRYRTDIWTLARINGIRNVNLILIGQRLCIANKAVTVKSSSRTSGITTGGAVRWYAYNALEWSSRSQVNTLLRRVAKLYRLPISLVLAVAWQESGWNQHVISYDGGIGVMQLMPGTAAWINRATGLRRDPYRLWDNLNLGAYYLYHLWHQFGGNLVKIVSAYNEGGWAVVHWGIFNWRYVNSVLALSRTFY